MSKYHFLVISDSDIFLYEKKLKTIGWLEENDCKLFCEIYNIYSIWKEHIVGWYIK